MEEISEVEREGPSFSVNVGMERLRGREEEKEEGEEGRETEREREGGKGEICI